MNIYKCRTCNSFFVLNTENEKISTGFLKIPNIFECPLCDSEMHKVSQGKYAYQLQRMLELMEEDED